jgi:hypothetical protein
VKNTLLRILGGAMAAAALLFSLSPAAHAQTPPGAAKTLDAIFGEGKAAFFATTTRILQNHPMKSLLSESDLAKVLNGQTEIPYLFERLIVFAYQKDEPRFSAWARAGDAASLEKFRTAFVALSEEYAARFVGSLFRKARQFEFEMSLPHNRGKSTLDLVLQAIGYNARNDLPGLPKDRWFTNVIKPDLMNQWAVDALDVRPCRPEATGAGVVVAVIDSGIDPYNSLFKDKLVAGVNFLGRTAAPWSGENPPMIDWGLHGTGCSSVVLAVAPDCKIMPVRVHDGDTMNDPAYDYWIYEFIAAGIYYAVNHGAQVISLSAPLPETELPLREATKYAYEKNVSICTAAGNISRIQFGLRLENQVFKAIRRYVIMAGGVAREDGAIRPWPITVPHDEIAVAAPSADVFVVVPVYMKDVEDMYVAGTSLAAPEVAGIAAILRSGAPPPPVVLRTPGEYCRLVAQSLTKTARLDVLGLSEPDDVVGYGLADARAALQMMKSLLQAKR